MSIEEDFCLLVENINRYSNTFSVDLIVKCIMFKFHCFALVIELLESSSVSSIVKIRLQTFLN